MIVMLCVDDACGTGFNRRRQSQDRALRAHVLALAGEKPLWLSAYSARQFSDCDSARLRVDEDFLQKADAGDFCFVELQPLRPVLPRIERLILFRWNRQYPFDQKLDLDLAMGWKLGERLDFSGYSHETLTQEVYFRG